MSRETTESINRQNAYEAVLTFLKEVRKIGKTSSKDWDKFRSRLHTYSLRPETLKAIDIWTMENLEHHKPELIRTRVLHEFEEQFIPAKVHGEFLEALRFGMVSQMQGEQIIDELLEIDPQGVLPETMMHSLSKTWNRNIQNYTFMKVN
jgi:hypothetical protein